MSLAARSLLFVPGDRERFLDKARTLDADALLVDLEDGVLPERRAVARDLIRSRIATLGRPVWVRVNPVGSGDLLRDLDAVVPLAGLAGLVIPKVADPAAIARLDRFLLDVEQIAGLERRSTRIIPMIESARGVVFAFAIATASTRVVSLCFGGARGGDLHADLGSGWSVDGPELLHARQSVLLAARAAGITWPLDGVFADVADADGFTRDTDLSRRLGFRGRTVIHPSQIGPTNERYAPTRDEIAAAQAVLEAGEAAARQGLGTATVDGRLVDRAMVDHARSVLGHAAAIAGEDGPD